jgi:CDP-diacylglycerol--glycerol-3-phosphate 3-phosphatidyltransferase
MRPQTLPFWKRELPNLITWSRIAAIPVVVWGLRENSSQGDLWSTIFFVVASVSDYFDGYFARIFNVESVLGRFLDPIADKLLVTAALIMLIPLNRISAVLVLIMLSRELLINGLRSVAVSEKYEIKVSWTAKWKTGAQMTALPFLMINRNLLGVDLHYWGFVLIWISVILSVVSAVQYMWEFFVQYRQSPLLETPALTLKK